MLGIRNEANVLRGVIAGPNFICLRPSLARDRVESHVWSPHLIGQAPPFGLFLGLLIQHSTELEPQALQRPVGVSLFRSVIGVIKSTGGQGANIDIMQ